MNRPDDREKAYARFPLLADSELEGFKFGRITIPNETSVWGDAWVEAPDGSRAGIVWCVNGHATAEMLTPPEPGRWGVYRFGFQEPARSENDLVRLLHGILPELKEFFVAAQVAVLQTGPDQLG